MIAERMDGVRICAIIAGVATQLACTTGPRSCKLESSSLVMFAAAIDTDDGVEVEVEFETATDLLENTGTSLALCPDRDQLTINGQTPQEVRALGHLYYAVEFSEPQTSISLSLDRGDDEVIEIAIELPPSFEIDSPGAQSSHSRAAELAMQWSPAWTGHEAALGVEDEIGSECIEGLGWSAIVDDNGSFVLPAETLTSAEGGSCEVKVSLTRLLESSYPEQLAPGGSIVAIVNRRLPFNSIP